MENNKYYTPEISEFFVGFEYEIYEDFDYYPEKTWHKQIYGKDGSNPENMGYVDEKYLHLFRVKYLSKEDIEELGFVVKQCPLGSWDEGEMWIINKEGCIVFDLNIIDPEDPIILVNNVPFKIKNKQEFKKLLKMIGIE